MRDDRVAVDYIEQVREYEHAGEPIVFLHYGGGNLMMWQGVVNSSSLTLINNLVADNHANTWGSGLWFRGLDTAPTLGRLLHTTIADNRSSGQGVFVDEYTTLANLRQLLFGGAGQRGGVRQLRRGRHL
jgi:hypothetical protein